MKHLLSVAARCRVDYNFFACGQLNAINVDAVLKCSTEDTFNKCYCARWGVASLFENCPSIKLVVFVGVHLIDIDRCKL